MSYLSKYDRTTVLLELIADMNSLVKVGLASPESAVNIIVATAKKHEDYPKEEIAENESAVPLPVVAAPPIDVVQTDMPESGATSPVEAVPVSDIDKDDIPF